MDQPSKPGGSGTSVTPSAALLNLRLAISNAPEMLTPSEIELLQQSKREIAALHRQLRGAPPPVVKPEAEE